MQLLYRNSSQVLKHFKNIKNKIISLFLLLVVLDRESEVYIPSWLIFQVVFINQDLWEIIVIVDD